MTMDLSLRLFVTPFLSVCLVAFVVAGCGGEDVTEPPSAIADRLAKAKQAAAENPVTAEQLTADVSAGKQTSAEKKESKTAPVSILKQAENLPTGEPPGEQETSSEATSSIGVTAARGATDAAAEFAPEPAAPSTNSAALPEQKAPVTGKTSSPLTGATQSDQSETMTAGGKTVEEIQQSKEKDESVAGAGLSLLEKLQGGGPEKKKTRPKRDDDDDVRQPITRFGRFATRAETWLKLQNQLSKRFFVAATADGRKLAASSGVRSLGVLSTQVEAAGTERVFARTANNVIAQTLTKQKVFTQPVNNLPGKVRALELMGDGDVVLIGTSDGRLLARSCANLQDWDIYAQDLFAFQDERRPATKVSDVALLAVRMVSPERLLTIDEAYKCAIWNTTEVVHVPIPALEMNEQQARSPEAMVLTGEPISWVNIRPSRPLNLSFSASRSMCAVVTSDEYITVFDTVTGHVIDTVSAAQLDDTQPVSALIDDQLARVTVGLADGRVFRRAFGHGTALQSTNDDGKTVDYEVVFAPDLGDRAGAITAMELNTDGRILYIGRLDGSITQFDLPRKQLLKTERLHKGPVVELVSTDAGLFSIGDDRVARLSDLPLAHNTPSAQAQKFDLPQDEVLKAEVVIVDESQPKQDKFTAARNFGRDINAARNDEVSLAGIRPSDPVLALYEHQLRVADSDKLRSELRQKIVKQRPAYSKDPESSISSSGAQLFAEINTEFDYQARPLRRAVMTISDDGKTVAAAQYFNQGMFRGSAPNQPVFVWDAETATTLRTWRRSPGIRRLDLSMSSGDLMPTPLSAKLNVYSGRFGVDDQQAYFSWAWNPEEQIVIIGRQGLPGVATEAIELRKAEDTPAISGVEAFEGVVPALALSADGASLFVSVRERTQMRLLELDTNGLQLKAELSNEPVAGTWQPEKADLERSVLGATHILPSPDGKILVTYGRYENGYQLRVWKKSGNKWPQDKVLTITSTEPMIEMQMTDTPFGFVNEQSSQLAMIGRQGVGVLSLRTGKIDSTLELPDVAGRRPMAAFSSDGRQLFVGDQDGNIWTWPLRTLDRKPEQLQAHAGPIVGLAVSRDGRFLASAGEENRIRIWQMSAAPLQAQR